MQRQKVKRKQKDNDKKEEIKTQKLNEKTKYLEKNNLKHGKWGVIRQVKIYTIRQKEEISFEIACHQHGNSAENSATVNPK